MHTARILDLTVNLPVKIEFIESAEKLDEILPGIKEMVGTGLIEVQDTLVIKNDYQGGARSLEYFSPFLGLPLPFFPQLAPGWPLPFCPASNEKYYSTGFAPLHIFCH